MYLFYAPGFGSAEGSLLVSFADEPQPKKYWGAPSEDGKSFFIRGTGLTGGVDGFIRSLRAHSRMTVVVTPKKREPFPEVSFDLGELDEALKPLLELCPMKEK